MTSLTLIRRQINNKSVSHYAPYFQLSALGKMSRCFDGESLAGREAEQGIQAGPFKELQPEGEEEPVRQKCKGKAFRQRDQ